MLKTSALLTGIPVEYEMAKRKRRSGLGDLPEDMNWREVQQIFYSMVELQPKKPIDELLLDFLEIGVLAPQQVAPIRNKPFKEDVRKFPIPGIIPTGTATGGTGTTG